LTTAAGPRTDPAPVAIGLPLDVEEYLSWLTVERGRSRNTLDAYRRDLSVYVAWLRARGQEPPTATEADVVDFVQNLKASGRAPASTARNLAVVRNLHRFLLEEGRAAADVTGGREAAGVAECGDDPPDLHVDRLQGPHLLGRETAKA
jgi:integrase/recombinase XerD